MQRAKQGEKYNALQNRVDQLENALQSANSKILPSPPLDASASVTCSTPRSTQGYSPAAHSVEIPRRTSSVTEVRNASVSFPTVGLSRAVARLGRLANHDPPAVFQPLAYDDSEDYIESELHQEEMIWNCGDPSRIDLSLRVTWTHQQAFVRNILPWFPLFNQDTCVHHMTAAQESQFSPASASTPIALYILALGAFSKADTIYGDDPREFPGLDYFSAARNIPEPPGIKHAIEVVQSQILRT